MSNQSTPQLQAVHKLPVVDGQQGVLLVTAGDGVPQVDGKLPNIDECLVVGQAMVKAQKLNETATHEGNGLEGGGGGELGVLHVGQVHRLYCRLQQLPTSHQLMVMKKITISVETFCSYLNNAHESENPRRLFPSTPNAHQTVQ